MSCLKTTWGKISNGCKFSRPLGILCLCLAMLRNCKGKIWQKEPGSCDKGLDTSHCFVSINLNNFYYGLLPFLLNKQSWSWSLLLKCSQLKDSFRKWDFPWILAHWFWFCFVCLLLSPASRYSALSDPGGRFSKLQIINGPELSTR